MSITAAPKPAKRPTDRKEQIARAAARAFAEFGYRNVSVGHIAAEVGITGRAIYRHFPSKHDLLVHTIFEALDALDPAVASDPERDDAATQIDSIFDASATIATERRELGVLLQREIRHLDEARRAEFYRRIDAAGLTVRLLLLKHRPELSDRDAELLARSAYAALASPSYHRATLPSGHAEQLIRGIVSAVLNTRALPRGEVGERAVDRTAALRVSRREEVLAAAIRLFAQRGYAATRMEDVGATVGIAGPSIYEHFTSKADLLMAALTRGAQWAEYALSRALSGAWSPSDALRSVVDSYSNFVLEHTDLVRVFQDEITSLPRSEQHVLRRMQHDYISEWIAALAAVRPDLPEPHARYLIGAVLGIIHDSVRPPAAPREGLQHTLREIAMDILTIGKAEG